MTNLVASMIVRLQDRLSAPAKVMQRSMQGINRTGERMQSWAQNATTRFEAMEERLGRLGQMTFVFDEMSQAGRRLTGFLRAPIGAAISLEEAMADVAKVTDFDPRGLKAFERDLLRLSRMPGMPTVSELAQIATQGAQGGVAQADLLQFTENAAKMGTAFDVSSEKAGKSMIGFRNIFQLTDSEAFRLGGTINHLSNTMATTARDITNVTNRAGAGARQFGLTAEQTSALAATMLELQVPPEVAGNAIDKMLLILATGDKRGKKFEDALTSIGLTGEDLKRSIERNPQRAFTDFLDLINEAEDKTGVLFDLFGGEYVDDAMRLAGGIDNYRKAQKLANDETAAATSLQSEFEARASTTRANIDSLNQSVASLAVNIGGPFLAGVSAAAGRLARLVGGVADLVAQVPILSTVIFGAIGALGALLTIVGSLGTALVAAAGFIHLTRWAMVTLGMQSLVSGGMLNVLTLGLWGLAKSAIPAAIIGLRALTVAMLANPIGLIVAAIAAAATLIYIYWDPVKAFFQRVFGAIGRFLSPVAKAFKTVFSWSPMDAVKAAWDGLTGYYKNLFGGITGLASKFFGGIMKGVGAAAGAIGRMTGLLDDGDGGSAFAGLRMATDLARQRAAGEPLALAGIDPASGLGPSDIRARPGQTTPNAMTYEDRRTTTIMVDPNRDIRQVARELDDERDRRLKGAMADVE